MSREKGPKFRRNRNPLIWLLRHLQMSLSSLGRLSRAPLSTLMTAAVIGIAIALPAGLHLLINNVHSLSGGWQGASSISLFLDQSLSDQQAKKFRDTIGLLPQVQQATLISHEAALNEFRTYSGFGAALALLKKNPLPAVILVRPTPQASSAQATGRLANKLRSYPQVHLAQVDLQWVRRLDAITNTLERGVYVLSGLLSAAVLLIIGNTIRLEIQNRHNEIEVVKMVGGTDAFIRRPFLYEGTWYGLIGALIAIGLVLLSMSMMQGPVARLVGLYHSQFGLTLLTSSTFVGILVGGPLLGLTGAWLAVGRHLKRIVPD